MLSNIIIIVRSQTEQNKSIYIYIKLGLFFPLLPSCVLLSARHSFILWYTLFCAAQAPQNVSSLYLEKTSLASSFSPLYTFISS